MNLKNVIAGFVYRVQNELRDPPASTSLGDALGLVRYELRYAYRQARAVVLREAHVYVESQVRSSTRDGKKHVECDYPDPPDHMVVACLCGKEFS